jgi:predicted DNA-binding protein
MKFDFPEQYKLYSTTDLLKIVKRPNDYQTAAVEAANEILKDRQISEADILEVEEFYLAIDTKRQIKKEKIHAYKEKTTDFLEPVLRPGTEIAPGKWINILLVIIGLQYLWFCYNAGRQFIAFLKCDTCPFDISYFIDLVSLLYIPVIFFLLFKRRTWGWILLFADNLFTLIGQLSQSYLYFKYWDPGGNDIASFFLPIIIKAIFAYFLWRSDISGYFNVTTQTKQKSAFITVIAALIFTIGMYIF